MIKNAKIEDTTLGYEGHGCFTFGLFFDYGDSGHQGFGDWALGENITDYTVKKILKVVGVDKWEDLKGKYVRVDVDGLITGVGNLLKDEWFYPKKEYEELKTRKEKNKK